jgi:glycosyltransferase involved in cell wall biosynthesis
MDANESDVAILMSTYNGEFYLAMQIRSILGQSWQRWKLYVRDDGSQDKTRGIIQQFVEKYPSRICMVPSNGTRLGTDRSFSCLLEYVQSNYFMFCDQDDVWLPRKIEQSMCCMQGLEGRYGSQTPLLVHTDLRVVNADLKELGPSVWHYGHHNPVLSQQLNRLLVQNMIFGCSILANASLKEVATPIPERAVQYDWWFGLVAAVLGRVGYLHETTSLYRQHGGNSVGTEHWSPRYIIGKASRFFDRNGLLRALASSRDQAAVLLYRFEDRLSPAQRELISAYVALGNQSFIERRKTLLKYGFWKCGLIRNIGLFLRI